MDDSDLSSLGRAVLGIVYKIVVVFVARGYIALIIVSQKHEVALVGDLAELKLLIEFYSVKMILLAEVIDKLVFGSLAGRIEDNLTYNVMTAAFVLERADFPFENRIFLVERILNLEEVNSLALLVNVGV